MPVLAFAGLPREVFHAVAMFIAQGILKADSLFATLICLGGAHISGPPDEILLEKANQGWKGQLPPLPQGCGALHPVPAIL